MVIEGKLLFRGRGVSLYQASDRKRVIEVLNLLSKRIKGYTLAKCMEAIIDTKYSNASPSTRNMQKDNIPKYIQCESSIGMKLLFDILEFLEVCAIITIRTPGKLVTIEVIEDE